MDSGAERMVRLAMPTMMRMRFDFLRGMTHHLMQLHLMMLLLHYLEIAIDPKTEEKAALV
jgi:hypothetical protein